MKKYIMIGALMLAAPAQAQNCASWEIMHEHLRANYGEEVAGAGLIRYPNDNNTVVQLMVNPETGTWTILVTSITTETACRAFSGDYFNFTDDEPEYAPDGEVM